MILRWNGTSWSVVGGVPKPGTGDSQLLSVRALSSGNAWAVGYDTEHAEDRTLILHWNGATWSRVSSPNGPLQNALRSVTARTSQDVWAVGFTNDAPDGTADSLILHWDGTSWRQVTSPSPAQTSDLFAVDVVSGSSDVWAAGEAGGSFTARVCPVRVSDSEVDPDTADVDVGSSVAWAFPVANTLSHSVTDDSGLGQFDSGPRSPGGSFVHTFGASGTHEIIDTATGHLSSIGVVPTSEPPTGGSATDFLLTWATADSAPPYTHDVEVQGPADGSYLSWQQGTDAGSGDFVPDDWQGGEGPGTYLIRARLRDTSTGEMTDWSPPVKIIVT
jgi:plastocyanin